MDRKEKREVREDEDTLKRETSCWRRENCANYQSFGSKHHGFPNSHGTLFCMNNNPS